MEHNTCNHYPWALVDQSCSDCEKVPMREPKFYCKFCDNYTFHVSIHAGYLSCRICNSPKLIAVNEKRKMVYRPCLYISPYSQDLNEKMYDKPCPQCKGPDNLVSYDRASFHCDVDGVKHLCIDMSRPLCVRCHLAICINMNHQRCKL